MPTNMFVKIVRLLGPSKGSALIEVEMVNRTDPLANEIQEVCDTLGLTTNEFRWVSDDEALDIYQRFESHFFNMDTEGWLWERFRFRRLSARFRDDRAYKRLHRIIATDCGNLFFIVENRSSHGFLIYEATLDAITSILGEGFRFEYYIVPRDFDWLVCENHHGFLIAVGEKVMENLKQLVLEVPEDILQADVGK